jgi:hypothetical protein
MKCIKCGKEIEDKSSVCPYCGAEQHAEGEEPGVTESPDGGQAGADASHSDGSIGAADETEGGAGEAGGKAGENGSASEPAQYDYDNADEATPYKYDMEGLEPEKGSTARFFIALVLVLAIAVFFVWYAIHLSKEQNKVPELGNISYTDFVDKYDLVSTPDSAVEKAYLDKVEIRFGDAERLPGASPFGADKKYSFKAEIYAPDLETIYSENTDESSIESAIENTPDSSLKKQDSVKVETDNHGTIKDDDADELQKTVENSFTESDGASGN